MTAANESEERGLDRQVNRLASERSTIFAGGGKDVALTESERQRIKAIDRELDDCYALRRQRRAARDARRFSRYNT